MQQFVEYQVCREKVRLILSDQANVIKIKEMYSRIIKKFDRKKALYAARIIADEICRNSSIPCSHLQCKSCITNNDIEKII